jgi:hypothetical protein
MRQKRKPEYTTSDEPITSSASAASIAANASAVRAAGTPSPKNTTSGLSMPPQWTHQGSWKLARDAGSSWASPSGKGRAATLAISGLASISCCCTKVRVNLA